MADEWTKSELSDDEMWNFEENNELVGTLVGFQEKVGANESTIYKVETEDGKRVSFWGSTVLDRHLQMIAVGTAIKIVYNGKMKSEKTGREYKDYGVYYKGTSVKKN